METPCRSSPLFLAGWPARLHEGGLSAGPGWGKWGSGGEPPKMDFLDTAILLLPDTSATTQPPQTGQLSCTPSHCTLNLAFLSLNPKISPKPCSRKLVSGKGGEEDIRERPCNLRAPTEREEGGPTPSPPLPPLPLPSRPIGSLGGMHPSPPLLLLL